MGKKLRQLQNITVVSLTINELFHERTICLTVNDAIKLHHAL